MKTDNPFAPVLPRQSFLETLGGREALRRLDDGLGAREPFLLVTGDPGTGKSTLANEAIARWGSRVTAAYLALPVTTSTELLEEILRRFGVEPPDGASRPKLVARLEGALAEIAGRGQVAIIVVDDAHHLTQELLEELRLLVNAAQQARRPLEVLLAGLPALEATLDDPRLAALRQRVSVRAKLEPLSAGETRRYIRHRVTTAGNDASNLFPRRICDEIAALSHGVPRQINTLAAEALRLARASRQPTVEAGHVRDAVVALSGVLPKGDVEDSVDAGPEVVSAPVPAQLPATNAAPPATPSPSAASPRASEKATALKAARAPTVGPTEPPAKVAETAPTSVEASVERNEGAATPDHVAPASHDPQEWVARFVGEKGPLQISSQAISRSSWTREESEAEDAIPKESSEAPPTRSGQAGGGPPRSHPRRGGGLRAVMTAWLTTIAVITVVVLGLSAKGKAPSHAAKVASVATTDSVAPQIENATSSRAPEVRSRAARATIPARAREGSSEGSMARPRGPYTLDAGVRLDLQTTLDERRRMQELTGIEGWVVPDAEPGAEQYRIVLGIFRSYARARAAADMLMRSRTLANVMVVSLPPRRTRQ